MTSQKPPIEHLPALDCLRGLAILAVFGFHSLGASYGYVKLTMLGNWPDWGSTTRSFYLFYPLTLGWVGVQLFFIVSGFSIHHSTLSRPDRSSAGAFVWRRFWRIVPTYLVVLAALVLWSGHFQSWQFFSHALLIHDVDPTTFFGINPSFWSLAVEWHIYLLYPLLLSWRQAKWLP
jgi:peptidoglycan/LPS O-acetylase OafA/YrhL